VEEEFSEVRSTFVTISWNSLAIYSAYMTEGLERLPTIAKKVQSVSGAQEPLRYFDRGYLG
jgi:hypothetical protein